MIKLKTRKIQQQLVKQMGLLLAKKARGAMRPMGLFVATVLINWTANYMFSMLMGLDHDGKRLNACLLKLEDYVKLEQKEVVPLLQEVSPLLRQLLDHHEQKRSGQARVGDA